MAEMTSLGVAERPHTKARKLKLDPLWLALPGLGFLALFLVWPTAQMLSVSVMDKLTGALTFAPFLRIWNGGPYLTVLSTTFQVACWTTVLCLVLGYPLAYWLSQKPAQQQRIATLFVLLPFWTSTLIKNFSWLVLLGRNGIVAKTMAAIGLKDGDQLLFGRTTVVFAMVHTLLPLAVVTMLPVMNQIDRRLMMAASTLGANGSRAFWQVFFQPSVRGVASAGLLVLVSSLGFFITLALVGGAKDTMIGQLIILQINELQNWQLGSALAAILLISTITICFDYDRIFDLSAVTTGSGRPTSADGPVRRIELSVVHAAGLICGTIEELWKRNIRGLRGGALLSLYTWVMIALLLVAGGLAVGFVTGFLQSFEELTVALFVGGGIKTTLPKQMWDGILLQVRPVIAAASVVVLIVVIVMFAIMEMLQARRSRTPGSAATQDS